MVGQSRETRDRLSIRMTGKMSVPPVIPISRCVGDRFGLSPSR